MTGEEYKQQQDGRAQAFVDAFGDYDIEKIWDALNNNPKNVRIVHDKDGKEHSAGIASYFNGVSLEDLGVWYATFKAWQDDDKVFHLPFYEIEELKGILDNK